MCMQLFILSCFIFFFFLYLQNKLNQSTFLEMTQQITMRNCAGVSHFYTSLKRTFTSLSHSYQTRLLSSCLAFFYSIPVVLPCLAILSFSFYPIVFPLTFFLLYFFLLPPSSFSSFPCIYFLFSPLLYPCLLLFSISLTCFPIFSTLFVCSYLSPSYLSSSLLPHLHLLFSSTCLSVGTESSEVEEERQRNAQASWVQRMFTSVVGETALFNTREGRAGKVHNFMLGLNLNSSSIPLTPRHPFMAQLSVEDEADAVTGTLPHMLFPLGV